MAEKQLKETRSRLLAQQFIKWMDDGDPKFISLWSTHKEKMTPEDIQQVMDHWHVTTKNNPSAKEKKIEKEDGGGEGFEGTVFTSTNSGVFTPTHGGSSAKRRTTVQRNKRNRKKKTGVEKLGAWLTDFSPERKSLSKGTPIEFAVDYLEMYLKNIGVPPPLLK